MYSPVSASQTGSSAATLGSTMVAPRQQVSHCAHHITLTDILWNVAEESTGPLVNGWVPRGLSASKIERRAACDRQQQRNEAEGRAGRQGAATLRLECEYHYGNCTIAVTGCKRAGCAGQ